MKALRPTEEVMLKRMLLEVRKQLPPGTPQPSLSEGTVLDDNGDPEPFIRLDLPPFSCRAVGTNVFADPGGHRQRSDWSGAVGLIEEWLWDAYKERDAMEELRKLDKEFGDGTLNEYAEAPDDEMFTEAERQELDLDLLAFASQVGQRFDSLKAQVGDVDEKLEAMAAQQARILAAIENLRASSESLSKKDWSSAALGTAVSMVASAVVPPEMARAMMLDFLGQLAHIKLLPP